MSCVLQQWEIVWVCPLLYHTMLCGVHPVIRCVIHHARNAALNPPIQVGSHVSSYCANYIYRRLCMH